MIKALKLSNGKLSHCEIESPQIKDGNDVKIKVCVAGVCGTDLSIMDGSFASANNFVPGHEISGVVIEKGEDVNHLEIGDRVCVNPYDFCSSCIYCVRGQTQFCLHEAMKTACGIMKNGGWEEFVVLPSHLCYALPETMSLKESVFCQPISNCMRGWDNIGQLHNESRIMVTGAGIIGLMWTSLFHYHGYRDVTVVEKCAHRREMAERMDLGFRVSHPDEIKAEYEKAVAEKDEVWGYDTIVDCTGDKEAIESSFKWLRKGSNFLLFGVCGQGVATDLEVYQIYKKEITVVGSYLNQFCFARTIKLVDGMTQRYLNFEQLDVRSYPLHEYEAAIEALRKGDICKAVFEFPE